MSNASRSARRPALVRLLGLFVLLAFALLLPRPALAGGSVTLASREPTEVDGKWKLNMTFDYGSVPPLPHIPMLFVFTPTVLYERTLTDKSPDKPVLTRMPLVNQSPINESLDVGFSDASGKIFKVTKFDFSLKRDHGFEAGEYDLQVKRSDDGVQMGQTIKLILKGDNAVVDRRSIMFTADSNKKQVKKDEPKKDDAAKKDEEPKKDEAPAGDAPAGDAPPKDVDVAAAPPPVPPKQGGCGCEVAGDPGVDGRALAAAMLGLSLVLRRRDRRARAA
ncbi:MAG: MYXO-CTERM sorting domain-containing protein [Byssovorax sp.]